MWLGFCMKALNYGHSANLATLVIDYSNVALGIIFGLVE
jgi:hypothetical protein